MSIVVIQIIRYCSLDNFVCLITILLDIHVNCRYSDLYDTVLLIDNFVCLITILMDIHVNCRYSDH
jgi:hypothetical protein